MGAGTGTGDPVAQQARVDGEADLAYQVGLQGLADEVAADKPDVLAWAGSFGLRPCGHISRDKRYVASEGLCFRCEKR